MYSDEFHYDNDSKRVPEKVFQHEPKASGEKSFGTYRDGHMFSPDKTIKLRSKCAHSQKYLCGEI